MPLVQLKPSKSSFFKIRMFPNSQPLKHRTKKNKKICIAEFLVVINSDFSSH